MRARTHRRASSNTSTDRPRLDASNHSNRRASIDRRPRARPIARMHSCPLDRSVHRVVRRRPSLSGPWSSIIHPSIAHPPAHAHARESRTYRLESHTRAPRIVDDDDIVVVEEDNTVIIGCPVGRSMMAFVAKPFVLDHTLAAGCVDGVCMVMTYLSDVRCIIYSVLYERVVEEKKKKMSSGSVSCAREYVDVVLHGRWTRRRMYGKNTRSVRTLVL